jgi:alpha-amylase/alpha-mannosidase (GH57 family)
MRNHLILHGHFYQPPRENPYTGLVPLQESAAPFHNWNQRITRECYAANTASRFLRYDGRIEDIVNNYEVLSFNFGPTLFWWLKQHAPHVYEAIIEADRRSVERNDGHGNAIAQAYNHTILPLDSPEDARIQIRWGLEDFAYHFDRQAEGMWLPETAVNGQVIDLLIEEGVRFIILSPWQAEAYFAEGSKDWTPLKGEPIAPWRPYRIDRPAGSIAVFFYNHELAEGISFGHYLQNADSLYTRLLGYHNNAAPGHLVHTATDGEVYGHHEPFGDMCLAALRRHVEREGKFRFTNYGYYLAQHPPGHIVRLRSGEDELGTSWSCAHGVSRWFKDCGCATGGEEGWNQRWRTPLRRSFEALSRSGREIYAREMGALSGADPEEIAGRYIDVLTGRSSHADFAAAYLRTSDEEQERRFFELLEGFRYRLFMFTSCGWFFNDISGLEPQQNIQYAHKTLSLFQSYSEEDLYRELEQGLARATSNLPEVGSGADLLADAVPSLSPVLEAATYFFIKLLVRERTRSSEAYGFFTLDTYELHSKAEKEAEAEIGVFNTTTRERSSYAISSIIDEEGGLLLRGKEQTSGAEPFDLEINRLPAELRHKITGFLMRATEESFLQSAEAIYEEARFAVIQTDKLQSAMPGIIRKSAELALYTLLKRYVHARRELLEPARVSELEELLSFTVSYELEFEKEEIRKELTDYFWDIFEQHDGRAPTQSESLVRLMRAFSAAGIKPDLTIPQKHVFAGVCRWRKRLSGSTSLDFPHSSRLEREKFSALGEDEREELRRTIALADTMGIYVDELKELDAASRA